MKDHFTTNEFVLVFRTNIYRKKDVRSISPVLDSCAGIIKWNVDRTDIDNVLRIEATHQDCGQVINLVTRAGYACEELTD